MADEFSFTLSSSSASGAAAAVADGSSVSRQTQQSVSSESSVSNAMPSAASVEGQGDGRSRSPSSRPRLPPMPEDAVVPFVQEENVTMQLVGQDGADLETVSAGARQGSSRDAARAPPRPLLPMYPQREPRALGAWMGALARGSPGTPRGRGEGQPPRVPLLRAMPAPMSMLPSLLPLQQPPPPMHGVMVAVDDFDMGELAQDMATDRARVQLGHVEPPLPPQPKPLLEGVIVASESAHRTPNGISQSGGISGPTSDSGGNQFPTGSAGTMAAVSPVGVAQHFRMD